MADSFSSKLPESPRKSLARATLACKNFAPVQLGPVIERAIALSGMTKDQAADALGYADQSVLAKWIAGTENPQINRIWAAPALRPWFLLALAESAKEEIEVETTFRLRRRLHA